MKSYGKLSLFLIISLLLASCGYYNPYVARSDSKPITLHRSMWDNQTNELALETTFYHALSDWLRKTKLITLTDSKEEAEYVLTGEINTIDYPEISYASNRVASELRANLSVSYKIIETSTGKISWQQSETLDETLIKVSDQIQLQKNKNAALAIIADDLAEKIYLHIINSIMRPDRDTQAMESNNTK